MQKGEVGVGGSGGADGGDISDTRDLAGEEAGGACVEILLALGDTVTIVGVDETSNGEAGTVVQFEPASGIYMACRWRGTRR